MADAAKMAHDLHQKARFLAHVQCDLAAHTNAALLSSRLFRHNCERRRPKPTALRQKRSMRSPWRAPAKSEQRCRPNAAMRSPTFGTLTASQRTFARRGPWFDTFLLCRPQWQGHALTSHNLARERQQKRSRPVHCAYSASLFRAVRWQTSI